MKNFSELKLFLHVVEINKYGIIFAARDKTLLYKVAEIFVSDKLENVHISVEKGFNNDIDLSQLIVEKYKDVQKSELSRFDQCVLVGTKVKCVVTNPNPEMYHNKLWFEVMRENEFEKYLVQSCKIDYFFNHAK